MRKTAAKQIGPIAEAQTPLTQPFASAAGGADRGDGVRLRVQSGAFACAAPGITRATRQLLVAALSASLLTAAFLAIFFVVPTERTMGDAQRIMYVHVSVAWLGLLGFVITAGSGLLYLLRRDLAWDRWSQASAELGWLACTLTLVTGSIWARSAWGTWWTWDPRLTTAFVLWLIYSGYLMVRSSQEGPHRRARVAAVVSIIGVLDVPLVILATWWFRGVHPVAPQMEPVMRGVLLFSAVSFAAFFGLLLALRRRQLRLESAIDALQQVGIV